MATPTTMQLFAHYIRVSSVLLYWVGLVHLYYGRWFRWMQELTKKNWLVYWTVKSSVYTDGSMGFYLFPLCSCIEELLPKLSSMATNPTFQLFSSSNDKSSSQGLGFFDSPEPPRPPPPPPVEVISSEVSSLSLLPLSSLYRHSSWFLAIPSQ